MLTDSRSELIANGRCNEVFARWDGEEPPDILDKVGRPNIDADHAHRIYPQLRSGGTRRCTA